MWVAHHIWATVICPIAELTWTETNPWLFHVLKLETSESSENFRVKSSSLYYLALKGYSKYLRLFSISIQNENKKKSRIILQLHSSQLKNLANKCSYAFTNSRSRISAIMCLYFFLFNHSLLKPSQNKNGLTFVGMLVF